MKLAYLNKIHDHFYGLHQLNPRRGYPLQNGENYRPFFIIGSGRSGNTLLRRILYSSPDIFIPPETYVLGRVVNLFKQNRHLDWKQIVYLILAQFEYHREFETFDLSLRPLAYELEKAPRGARSLAFLLDSFYQYCAKSKDKAFCRWGDKTPLNTFFLDEISSIFPHAQYIHLVRDGCDAIPSYVKSGIYLDIESAAQRWCDSIKKARKFISENSNNSIEIKYEKLVSEPEIVTRKIRDFLEIDFFEKMLVSDQSIEKLGDVVLRKHHNEVLNPISISGIGKGRSSLSDHDRQLLHKIIERELTELGYESCLL